MHPTGRSAASRSRTRRARDRWKQNLNGLGWTVTFEAAGDDPAVTSDRVDTLVELLAEFAGAVSVGRDRRSYRATFSLADARDAQSALTAGHRVFTGRAMKAGLPAWPIVRVETTTSAEHNRDVAMPVVPGLCGVSEVAERAGVTRQRASRLARSPNFPAPIAELAAGPVWAEPTVERFLEAWRRKRGRPAKEVIDADAAERDGHVK